MCIWGFTLNKKRSEREVDFSVPYNAELKDDGFTATPPVGFYDVQGKIYISFFTSWESVREGSLVNVWTKNQDLSGC
jgi:hypothetical protein